MRFIGLDRYEAAGRPVKRDLFSDGEVYWPSVGPRTMLLEMPAESPFWKTKTLEAMTQAEWESVCDGCGRCCLHKLRHDDDNSLSFTNVACRLLDLGSCRCRRYETRQDWVPDCVNLTPEEVRSIDWLPPSCGYRRLAEGRDLAWWHPLVSGDPNTVHAAGVSVRGRAVSERHAGPLEHHVVDWPGRIPRPRRPPPPNDDASG